MAAKLLILAACLALSSAMVRRDAPAAAPLDDIQKHAKELGETISKSINDLVNSPDTKNWSQAVKDNSDSVLQNINTFSASLAKALENANGKAKEALEASRANLERTAEELRRQHPEVEKQAGELKNKLQQAIQNTLQESQTLAKTVAANIEQTNQALAPQLKAAYEDFAKGAQEVQKKLHEAATKQ